MGKNLPTCIQPPPFPGWWERRGKQCGNGNGGKYLAPRTCWGLLPLLPGRQQVLTKVHVVQYNIPINSGGWIISSINNPTDLIFGERG